MKRAFISYVQEFHEKLSYFVADVLLDSGYRAMLSDKSWTLPRSIGYDDLVEDLRECDLFIGILRQGYDYVYSDYLMWELGFAMGLGKDVLLLNDTGDLRKADDHFPPFLNSVTVLEGHSVSELTYKLVNYLDKLKKQEHIASPKRSTPLETYLTHPDLFEKISSSQFEEYVFDWLSQLGFEPSHASDSYQGFDLFLGNYKGNTKTIVEIKRLSRNSKVSIGYVTDLLGKMILVNADCGILITSSDYTSSALEVVNHIEQNIELWTLEDLLNLGS